MACLVSLDDLHFRNATRIPRRLQESTKVAKINSLGTRVVPKQQQQEQGGGSGGSEKKEEDETFYDFDYSLETTRGNKRVLSTVCIKAGVLFIAGAIYAAPYRMRRLMTFLEPEADPLGAGFQVNQALISFGSGEWILI